MTARENPSVESATAAEGLQALLLLLPAAVLAWPLGAAPLLGVPTAASAGVGIAALASLPAAVLLVLRRTEVRVHALVLFLVVLALSEVLELRAGDSFEARRAVAVLETGLVLLLGGASLGERGRVLLARGLVLLSLVWIVRAGIDGAHAFTGVLENTGALSEAALPGAVLGIGAVLGAPGAFRLVGAFTLGAYAVYAGAVPVYAGGAALVVVAAAAFVVSIRNASVGRHARLALAGLLVFAVAAGAARLASDDGDAGPADTGAVAAATGDGERATPGDFGGFAFRWLTWKRVPALVRDHAWLGVGPGQFARDWPRYRDPDELELSSHGRLEPTPIEVEHAHNDWLEPFAELGLIGGLAWALFLAVVGVRALGAIRAPRGTGEARAAFGLAALAVLANALVSSPLLEGPAAHAVAFPVLGVVLGAAGVSGRSRRVALLLPILAALLLGTRAVAALDFARHGRALAGLADARVVSLDGTERLGSAGVEAALERALAFCPDSVDALSKRAALLRESGAPPADQLAAWASVLEPRPHRFEALIATGNLHARARRFAEARASYERAAAVDAANPTLLKNRVRLALDEGDRQRFLDAMFDLDRLGSGTIDDEWLSRAGAEQLLRGRPSLAQVLLTRVDPTWTVADVNRSWALSQELAGSDAPAASVLADGCLANAHRLFARGHVADGKPGVAVRSYRQSLRVSRDYPFEEGGARSVRLELAAAQVLAETPGEAAATLAGLAPTALEIRDLPDWAGEALYGAGLLRN